MRTPRKVHVWCSAILLIVLVSVMSLTMGLSDRISAKQSQMTSISDSIGALRDVQAAIAAEAFAESAYWQNPTAVNRAAVQAAAAKVPVAVAAARPKADADAGLILSGIEADNARYVQQTAHFFRAGASRPQPATVSGDSSAARRPGLALQSMNQIIATAVDGRRADYRAARDDLGAMTDEQRWLAPVSILVFLLTLIICWVVVIRVGQRESQRADQAALDAARDPLTGLANRRVLGERVAGELQQRRRIALLMIDLDRFKEVNDVFGHQAGDALLRAVAQELTPMVRSGDVVARLGGDEFAILLCDPLGTERVRRDATAGILRVAGEHGTDVSASIGVALAPEDGETLEDLMAVADERLYRAKRATHALGRPRVVHITESEGRPRV